jgi:xylulokinase
MSVRHILETCGAARVPGAVLRVTGGSSRLDLWNQIRADVTGMRVEVVEQADASCLGAAMLAAVGVGMYGTLAEAGAMVHVRAVCVPDETRKTLYDALFTSYRALYPALSPVFASVAAAATDSP